MKFTLVLFSFLILNSHASFYKNSRRRMSTSLEKKRIAKTIDQNGKESCTAFYIKNHHHLPLIATARHCLNDNPEKWCTGGKFRAEHNQSTVACSEVLAWHPLLDIVLLKMEKNIKGIIPTSIFTGIPLKATRLNVIGYPVDKHAYNGANTIENCWLKKAPLNSPHKNSFDTSASFNCSIYGGNSGGPVLIENSDIAIGMPSTYTSRKARPRTWDLNRDPWTYRQYDKLALFKDFVSFFRDELESLGVDLIDTQQSKGSSPSYFSLSRCQSAVTKSQPLHVMPLYMTSDKLKKLQVEFEQSGDKIRYTCQYRRFCKSDISSDSFTIISNNLLLYKTSDMQIKLYRCYSK